jgi:hypothetical protein
VKGVLKGAGDARRVTCVLCEGCRQHDGERHVRGVTKGEGNMMRVMSEGCDEGDATQRVPVT